MLCYRCEYRADYLETGSAPRLECKDIKNSNHSCYMYKPVAPMILKNKADDNRGIAGEVSPMISARANAIKIAKVDIKLVKLDNKEYSFNIIVKTEQNSQ